MSVAFSSSDQDCIEKKIEVSPLLAPKGEEEARIWKEFDEYFQIQSVVEWIKFNHFRRVMHVFYPQCTVRRAQISIDMFLSLVQG